VAEKLIDRDKPGVAPVSSPSQADRPATVKQDIGRPGVKKPARPDNIYENPVGQSTPPVDQR
jgi:hypothetical protein